MTEPSVKLDHAANHAVVSMNDAISMAQYLPLDLEEASPVDIVSPEINAISLPPITLAGPKLASTRHILTEGV